MTPSLHFYVNMRKDKEYIEKYRSIFEKILGKKEFNRYMKKAEKITLETLKKEMEKIENNWRKKEKKFFKVMKEEFGKWRRKLYFCHISSTYVCGGGYEYPTIIVFPFSEHVDPLHTIMHELIHLHLIEDMKRLSIKPKNYFEFAEIGVAIMSKKIRDNFDIPILFPDKKIERKFIKIEDKIQKIKKWEEKLNFLARIL